MGLQRHKKQARRQRHNRHRNPGDNRRESQTMLPPAPPCSSPSEERSPRTPWGRNALALLVVVSACAAALLAWRGAFAVVLLVVATWVLGYLLAVNVRRWRSR